jgi:adenylate cyclase
MLNAYFSDMIDVIFKHKGILDKYIGDAIMAVFGVPFPGPQDAENAVRAANEMMSALGRMNEQRAMMGIPEIHIGVGLSTGELISGNIGSLKRMDYTVIGDTVNLASRLEGTTKFYRAPVVFSESTRQQLPAGFRCRELDLIRVKGKNKPVAIYEGLDHYDEATFPGMEKTLACFEGGLAAYRRREWKAAIERFQEAFAANREDGPTQIYLERSRHYLNEPPGDDWDGVFTMTEK